MKDKAMLMIPGPTPVPESVLLAMAQHPIGHRSGEFGKITGEINTGLQWLFQTQQPVLTLAASGTGAMEAGIINFLSAGDKVLVGSNGKFGQRWADMAKAFGLEVQVISAEWGKPLDPAAFRSALEADSEKAIKAVVITHSETSAAVLNDLAAINQAVKAHGESLIIVDAVTSLGAYDLKVDEMALDVVGSGSQKGFMIPPGLGFLTVSDKAWAAYDKATLPRFYFDLGKYRKSAAKDSTPFTPPVNLYFALHAALKLMQEEGLEAIFARHRRHTNATRAAMKALSLPLLAADDCASTAATAVMPTGVEAEKIRSVMKQQFGIALAGGQDHLKGKIFRVGHLGFICDRDILTTIASLEATLQTLGYDNFVPGSGVAAANQELVPQ
ncbi:MAG: alanine--glyoxylate aminotransferase family protein [Cyanobacteria bacterium J06632_22]